MKRLAIASTLALSACGSVHTPPPAVEIRTVTIEKPIAVSCVAKGSLPEEPTKIANLLTGDPVHDLDLLAANALRLRAWGSQLHAVLVGCGG